MHDEAHDGLEVVSMEGDLALLRHVHSAGMPRPPAAANPLDPLASIGGLESVYPTGEAGEHVCWDHLQQSGVGRSDFSPCVTQPHQALRHTPIVENIHVHVHVCTCISHSQSPQHS